MPRFTDIGSYVTGIPTGDERGFLVLSIDELAEKKVPHCVIIAWEAGKFLSTTQKGWLLADVVQAPPTQNEHLLFFGTHGPYLEKDRHGDRNERITGPGIAISDHGPLRCARTIGGSVYVVGGDRQAYQLTERGWQSIAQGTVLPGDDGKIFSFEAVDGFAADEIYAVGLRGEIWLYNGSVWHNLTSPTNVLLSSVCCAGDNTVYAAGLQGLLLHGRGDTWEVLDVGEFPYDFWDLCWFQGALYLATMYRVYRLDGETLTPLDCGVDTAGKLACTDNVLWSIGAKDVVAFDGQTWSRID